MKTKMHKLIKSVWVLALAAIVAGVINIPAGPAFAASKQVNVTINNVSDLPEGTQFTFDLYRVGESGKTFRLNAPYTESGAVVTTPSRKDYTDEDMTWQEKWQESANTLANWIKTNKDSIPAATYIGATTITAGEDGTITLPEDGLYLLVGRDKDAGDFRWSPKPMYLGLLNGGLLNIDDIQIKLDSHKIVYEHRVTKIWAPVSDDDKAIEEAVQPEEIKVKISFGDEVLDIVTLNDDNTWSVTWKSLEPDQEEGTTYTYTRLDKDGEPEKTVEFEYDPDNTGWAVSEMKAKEDGAEDNPSDSDVSRLRYYSTTIDGPETGQDGIERFTITNTLTTKNVKIIKTLDGFDKDMQNVTLAFKITGKDASGAEIYTNHVGISFGPGDNEIVDGKITKERILTGIPADVTELSIVEEYSGNYKPDGDPQIEVIKVTDEETGVETVTGWTIKMDNKHDDHGPGGGVVNKYTAGSETPEQDYGN